MKMSLLSILLLIAAGAAPTTQPAATELPELRRELASLALIWAPYGANYPGAAEAKAKITQLKERIAKLEADVPPGVAPARERIDRELLITKQRLSQLHPNTPETTVLEAYIAKLEASRGNVDQTVSTVPASKPLDGAVLRLKTEIAVSQMRFGTETRYAVWLKATVARFEAAGGKIESEDVNRSIQQLTDERQQLLKTYGMRYPAVIDNGNAISYLKSLVAGDGQAPADSKQGPATK